MHTHGNDGVFPSKCYMRTTPIKTAELVSGRYKIRRPIKDA